MHTDYIVLDSPCNLSYRQGRGVCSEDCFWLTNIVQLGEQALLCIHCLKDGFYNQVGVCQVLVFTCLQVGLDLGSCVSLHLSLANQFIKTSANLVDSALSPLNLHITYSYRISSGSKCLSNALSHGSCTNNTNLSHKIPHFETKKSITGFFL